MAFVSIGYRSAQRLEALVAHVSCFHLPRWTEPRSLPTLSSRQASVIVSVVWRSAPFQSTLPSLVYLSPTAHSSNDVRLHLRPSQPFPLPRPHPRPNQHLSVLDTQRNLHLHHRTQHRRQERLQYPPPQHHQSRHRHALRLWSDTLTPICRSATSQARSTAFHRCCHTTAVRGAVRPAHITLLLSNPLLSVQPATSSKVDAASTNTHRPSSSPHSASSTSLQPPNATLTTASPHKTYTTTNAYTATYHPPP